MKLIARLVTLVLLAGGWCVAAMCIHVVRTPDPVDSSRSKLVIVPKDRLGIADTYVDARSWTHGDIAQHSDVIERMIRAGKADALKYLTDAKSTAEVKSQLIEAMSDRKNKADDAHKPGSAHSAAFQFSPDHQDDAGARTFHFDIDY